MGNENASEVGAVRDVRREYPILFSAPMVKAILDGRKTQTRRIVVSPSRKHPRFAIGASDIGYRWPFMTDSLDGSVVTAAGERLPMRCPFGREGDRMWVRETWTWNGGGVSGGSRQFYDYLMVTYAADGQRREIRPVGEVKVPKQPKQRPGELYSLRDAPTDFVYNGESTYVDRLSQWWGRKIPAIHMMRWASRIDLNITRIRVQRLHDISEDDARAEGVVASCNGPEFYCHVPGVDPLEVTAVASRESLRPFADSYFRLWAHINGEPSMASNPWVWVVTFKRL